MARVPYVPQMEAMECGAAALASVLGYWGHHAPLSEVRERCHVSRDGANGASLVEAARGYGLAAEAFSLEVEHLSDLPLPAILHWEFKHFLVLERLDAKGAWLVDPAQGPMRVSTQVLERCFTGVAFCFEPDPGAFQLRRRPRLSLHRYLEQLRGLRAPLLQVLGASLVLQGLSLVLPVVNQRLVDRVLLPGDASLLWGLGLALALAGAAQAALIFSRGFILQRIRTDMDRILMLGFVRHLASLPVAFFLQRQPGDLIQRVESNTYVRDLFSSRSLSALLDGLIVLGAGTMMFVQAPALGALVLLLALVRVGFLLALRRRQDQVMAAELMAGGQEQGALVEALSGLETMKASGSQAFVLDRWTHRLVRRLNRGQERLRLSAAAAQALTVLQGLSMAAVFAAGGAQVLSGQMSLGLFAAFLTLQHIFTTPLEGLLTALTDLQYLGTYLARLDDVMETPSEPEGPFDPGPLRGDIRLEGVSFRYAEGSPWVLRDLELHIRPGEKIALVGSTGAGKTSLARLLVGMHLPTQGYLAFDGHRLSDLRLGPLRAQLGVVPQDSFLLDDTVRANLSLGNPDLPLERLREAARLACIDHVIENLPQGWDTRLGENGAILSGGERQRLCLARALASRPAILLLDEATSALDLETEARVHAQLATLGCTRILIAHRLETVRDADCILVLREGRLVQMGGFDALAAHDGPFRDAVRAMEASRG